MNVTHPRCIDSASSCFRRRFAADTPHTTLIDRRSAPIFSLSLWLTPKAAVKLEPKNGDRAVRLALPSKGRMAEDTLSLLKDCQLSVHKPNPRQYVASVPTLPGLEVWFQRASDVVRKIREGDVDLGIVGYDMVCEYGEGDDNLIIVHDALQFGKCELAMGIPTYGIFDKISSLEELKAMDQWTAERPLRIVTGYTHLAKQFIENSGLKHVKILTADGALEAAPAMGTSDAIIDLVSSGTTLRENNLKMIDGGLVLESQGVLVANKRALQHSDKAQDITHEILERLEAHLVATDQFTVIANMRGGSSEEVANVILKHTNFHGFQGPTISPVYSKSNGKVEVEYYAIVICVPKKRLYDAVIQLRKVGGSGVLVSPLTYIFDEEPSRWRQLLEKLGQS